MEPYSGKTLSWSQTAETIELRLHNEPCNEIGSATLGELERFGEFLDRPDCQHGRWSSTANSRRASARAPICGSCTEACRRWKQPPVRIESGISC